MKKSNTFTRIARVLMIAGISVLLNIGCAQTNFASASNAPGMFTADAGSHDVEPASMGAAAPATSNTVVDQMSQNPTYWINFLENQIQRNENQANESNASSFIEQLQLDSRFWLNYLKTMVNPTYQAQVLTDMDEDSHYWMHYLVLSQSANTL